MKSFPVQKLIALSLVIFMSGTCCLLCCETMKAAPSPTSASDATAESCPMGKGHHCCPKSEGETNLSALSGEMQSQNCCPFISKRSDLARKAEPEKRSATAQAIKVSLPEFFTKNSAPAFPENYQTFVRDRGGTYLKNCVFRI